MNWSKPAIDKERTKIRAWLDSLALPPKEKLRLLLGELKAGLESADPKQQMRLFLLCVFALVHHLRHLGLSPKDIRWIAKLGDTLLRVRGIESSRSRVSFLYGDFHLMLSQIYWRQGKQWDAAWEQLLAKVQETSGGQVSVANLLALANRALRMGQATHALHWLDKAEILGLEGPLKNQADLKRLMIYRLQNLPVEADRFEQFIADRSGWSAEERREIAWEKLTRQAQREGNVQPLLLAVQRRGDHHENEFAMEAFLWSRSVASLRWMKQYPSFRKLVYSGKIQVNKKSPLFRAVNIIEQCYDPGLNMLTRLRDLGALLGDCPKLINVNQELLIRAAALRWLIRVNAPDAARLVKAEYESLSRKLTDGHSDDVLSAFAGSADAKAA